MTDIFRNAKYVSGLQALWRPDCFGIEDRGPSVVHSDVQFEEKHTFYSVESEKDKQHGEQEQVVSLPNGSKQTSKIWVQEICDTSTFQSTLLGLMIKNNERLEPQYWFDEWTLMKAVALLNNRPMASRKETHMLLIGLYGNPKEGRKLLLSDAAAKYQECYDICRST